MNKQREFFPSTNGSDSICYYKYLPEGEVKGIFQIVHGMAENAERYESFAKYLCDMGWAVYAHEHVGHGGSVKDIDHLGLFLDANQAETMVEDTRKMCGIAKEENPGKKYVLMGHSMGSFVVRLFAAKYGNTIDGLIISGTGGANPAAGAGIALIKVMKAFKGKDFKSTFVDNMAFGRYNDRYETHRTRYDWLSRDDKIVDQYIASPYCGFLFSLDGMKALMEVNKNSNKPQTFKSTPKSLPIFMVSGEMDPVGDWKAGAKMAYDGYIAAGMENCTLKIYPNARHEILNELNKEEVYADLSGFANKIIGA